MTGLPTSLAIGLWLTGSFSLIAILADIFDAPNEVVYITFVIGVFAALAEWLAHRGNNR